MFHDYVSKVDRGVQHVAMCAGGWWTGACRNCLVLPPRRRRGSRAGAGWAQQAWCCCQGAAVVHMWARGTVLDACAQCERAREAMRAGVEGSCVRRARVWELHPNMLLGPDVRALVSPIPEVLGYTSCRHNSCSREKWSLTELLFVYLCKIKYLQPTTNYFHWNFHYICFGNTFI